ncbi:hypothetical protein LEP1GSC185_2101 [Leptospira licerasiae serovar Varillal str. VAR 010]|uniref:Uncharacterized protein n=1 Tax=Leptospira licerasiae str. MMD4847 TaxID=1049971 RepID=A0ABN0H6N1_9LEPT|nr:hypothetical protein LEP1GSC185_2101 [Leptospira licerasiae serovar Varillal str. VAR 010]EJZ41246.1 hypothetical protein LEP1GSC178_1372 [Leptospira licerasiae str. MMD4847]
MRTILRSDKKKSTKEFLKSRAFWLSGGAIFVRRNSISSEGFWI